MNKLFTLAAITVAVIGCSAPAFASTPLYKGAIPAGSNLNKGETYAELLQTYPNLDPSDFDAADVNHDGRLSMLEFGTINTHKEQYSPNSNG
jgi:hypothetical protein